MFTVQKSWNTFFLYWSKNVDSISEIMVVKVKVCDLGSSLNRACASACNVAPDSSSSYRHPIDQWQGFWLSASLGPSLADAVIGCVEGGRKLRFGCIFTQERGVFSPKTTWVFSVDLCSGSGGRCGFDRGTRYFLTSAVKTELVFDVWS